MDRYTARINLHGATQRERQTNLLKMDLINKAIHNPSCKQIKLNGLDTRLIINSGTSPYSKSFASFPGQKIYTGDYIEWANNIWLVYEADCDDEIYTDGTLRQCQHKINWQTPDGKLISRYVWTQNASAYNNGEQGNNTITLQSNQFMVYMPYDEDTKYLDNGMRIHMSKSNVRCKPYILTRPDDISYGYGEKGNLNIIFTQDQYHKEVDKLVTLEDGSKVWICDYHSPTPSQIPDETTDLSVLINGGKALRCGRAKTWTAIVKDKSGNEIDNCSLDWSITSNFNIPRTDHDNKIQLRIDDDSLIGESFLLSVTANNIATANIEVTVAEGL